LSIANLLIQSLADGIEGWGLFSIKASGIRVVRINR